jgi:SNF2 family DNA or RNA helicase
LSTTILAKLRQVRQKDDITLPEAPNLRKTILDKRGNLVPLTLRSYQRQMVVNLMAMNRFVVGDDTGLGKTVETIAALCQLWNKDPNMKVFILTKKSSVPQWEEEFERFTLGVQVFMAIQGPQDRVDVRKAWWAAKGPAVLIQGYTSACNDMSHLQKLPEGGYVLVCDEATVFKTPSSRVHKVVRHIAGRADRCWGLTATLIKNNLMEGFGIYNVVVPTLFQMSEAAFRNNYCIVNMREVKRGRKVPEIVGYHSKDIQRFREQIELYYLGRPKHAVAKDLPVLETKTIKVGLTNFQAEKYNEALTGFLEHGDGEMRDYSETVQMTKLIYCQEIVNHPGLIEFHDYPSEKLDALVELLTEGGDLYDQKVIVFTRFKTMVDIAIPILEKAGIKCTRVTGDESDVRKRKAAMDVFQDEASDTKVIWITMAGGDAINLQAAKALVFFDTPWSAGDYIQIVGRMIRVGSIHDRCYAIHLVARDTIDEHVQKIVKKKMKLIEDVLGERIKGEKGEDVIYQVTSDAKDLIDMMVQDARTKK